MATTKNITMKQFNGTDYDTLYPKTIASQIPDVYSKTEVLTTETLSKYGLTADKLPNDVFQQIKTLIDNVQASADGKARIQTGSYVGTGTYGESNPCSLTFDFAPKFFFVYCNDTISVSNDKTYPSYGLFVFNNLYNIATFYSIYNSYSTVTTSALKTSCTGNTVTWYCTSSSGYTVLEGKPLVQFNHNTTYHYIAIG